MSGQAAVPTGEWLDATGSLEGITTDFGNVTYLSAKPDEDRLIAGLSGVGLWESVNGDTTWHALGSKGHSASISNRTTSIQYDPDHPEIFWEAGSYGPALFQTTDNGGSFSRLGSVQIFDSLSIDFDDPDRQTLLAPGHEQGRILWLSTDGGSKWTDLGEKLPAGAASCSFPLVLHAKIFLIACTTFNSTTKGMFRSTDSAQTWTQVSEFVGGFAPLQTADGSIYYPLEGNGGLIKSTDQGETWSQIFEGSLAIQPIALPDGSIVTATKQYLVASADGGMTWKPITSQPPFEPDGLTYSSFQKALYIWTLTTMPEVPAQVIVRYDLDPNPAP